MENDTYCVTYLRCADECARDGHFRFAPNMRLLLAIVAFSAFSVFAEEPKTEQKPGPAGGSAGPVSGSAGAKAGSAEKLKPDPTPISGSGEALDTLPSDYRLLVGQCMERFQARDFTGALVAADKADKLMPPTVWTINVRGAVAIERRQFKEGEAYCVEALQKDAQFFPALFNLCEIPFLKGRYAEARAMWEKLLAGYPAQRNSIVRDGTPELLIYRIFLCYLLDRDLNKAKAWLDRLPFPSDTAAYYYAHAAWEKANGHEDQWKYWLRQAEFIWPAAKRTNFTDVLMQIGWIKSDQPETIDASRTPSLSPK